MNLDDADLACLRAARLRGLIYRSHWNPALSGWRVRASGDLSEADDSRGGPWPPGRVSRLCELGLLFAFEGGRGTLFAMTTKDGRLALKPTTEQS